MEMQETLLDLHEIYEALQRQAYADIPFPLGRGIVEEVVAAFFKFLELPDNIKTCINFSIAPQHRRGDVGYKHRDPSEDIYNDSKEFFHFHPAIFEQCEDFLEENPVVKDFMLKAKPIWNLACKTVEKTLKTLEPRFPEIYNKIFGTDEEVHILLRFLRYDWQHSGKYLAKPHFDAGSFTLAIAESCSGLRIGKGPETLKAVEHKDGNAIFMLASNYQKVINTDELSPGWHDVIQLDETMINKPFSRWAVVAFVEAHGVKALPRAETHKWYQHQ